MVNILSWNIAGLRASLNRGDLDFLLENNYDIVCLQETKAEESQVKIPIKIMEKYPFRYWQSNKGITQRKGFSGTCIWSNKPAKLIDAPEIDQEGRVTTLEYDNFIIVNVYTPNSQSIESLRFEYRTNVWDSTFRQYISDLKNKKHTIVCGDLNVAHKDIDVYEPKRKIDRAGFIKAEKDGFQQHLDAGFIDAFRYKCNKESQYTYWDQRFPHLRKNNRGWRIDYFLLSKKCEENIIDCLIHKDVYGSDHCPISLKIEI